MKNDSVRKYFLNQLNEKKSVVSKDDILHLALECGLDVKPRLAKSKIIDMIIEHGFYDKLFEYFNEFVTIPSWEVADYYNISTAKVDQLRELGAIKEQPISKEFYSRKDKDYFDANTYPLSVLNYNEEELKKAYDNAFGGDIYSLRVETKNKNDINQLISIFEKIFIMDKSPITYPHRNEEGAYTYFKVKVLNDSKEAENRWLAEISKLNAEKEKLIREQEERIDKIFNILKVHLGDDLSILNLDHRLDKLAKSIHNSEKQ